MTVCLACVQPPPRFFFFFFEGSGTAVHRPLFALCLCKRGNELHFVQNAICVQNTVNNFVLEFENKDLVDLNSKLTVWLQVLRHKKLTPRA